MQLRDLGVIPDGSLLIDGERIHQVGSTRRIENLAAARSATVIDVTGKVVLPGFVDSHTQLLFSPPALRRFEAEIEYGADSDAEEIAPHPAHRSLRTVSPKVLRLRAERWARLFAAHGTTTIEARSHCGLALQSELKTLKVARALDGSPIEVVAAFLAGKGESLGAEEDPESAVEQITEVLLPIIRRRRLASFCDVPCDPRGFSLGRSRRILQAASRLGFRLRVQADRTRSSGGVSLAVEMKATSAEHLLHITHADMDDLARSSTVATLLPGVVYHRGETRFAPARDLAERGAAVALATGFTADGSPTLSMPMVLSLACTHMRMLPGETISAATINGAASIRRAHLLGSLEPGKQADLAVFDVADYREIPYYFGVNLCLMTMKKGKIIYHAPGSSWGRLPAPDSGGPRPSSRSARRAPSGLAHKGSVPVRAGRESPKTGSQPSRERSSL